jgi:hypothetical protein
MKCKSSVYLVVEPRSCARTGSEGWTALNHYPRISRTQARGQQAGQGPFWSELLLSNSECCGNELSVQQCKQRSSWAHGQMLDNCKNMTDPDSNRSSPPLHPMASAATSSSSLSPATRSDNLHQLPPDLPTPVDDGACNHLLPGLPLPSLLLSATRSGQDAGSTIDLSSSSGRVLVYIYPRTGLPHRSAPEGWNQIPGMPPSSCLFRLVFSFFCCYG